MKLDVLTVFEDDRFLEKLQDLESLVSQVKDQVVSRVKNEVDFLKLPKNFEVNLCLSDDQTVHSLNKEFRGMDKPTNVLSFANIDDPFFENMLKNEDTIELGDVIMAYETLKKEAEELDVSFKDHFCHLFVHGLLHILGFDHIDPDERLEMEAREIDVLQKIGIDNPYQE